MYSRTKVSLRPPFAIPTAYRKWSSQGITIWLVAQGKFDCIITLKIIHIFNHIILLKQFSLYNQSPANPELGQTTEPGITFPTLLPEPLLQLLDHRNSSWSGTTHWNRWCNVTRRQRVHRLFQRFRRTVIWVILIFLQPLFSLTWLSLGFCWILKLWWAVLELW